MDIDLGINEDKEKLSEVLKVVSEEVPRLIENILKPIKDFLNEYYSEENVRKRANAFIIFYKSLIENGIPEKEALELAKGQLLDINKLISRLSEMKTVP
jgi:hypothetical protein